MPKWLTITLIFTALIAVVTAMSVLYRSVVESDDVATVLSIVTGMALGWPTGKIIAEIAIRP